MGSSLAAIASAIYKWNPSFWDWFVLPGIFMYVGVLIERYGARR